MQNLHLKFIGNSALLLHSDRGANPIAPQTVAHKALTSKRTKTDEDQIAIARSEYMLAFYPGDKIVLPTTNIKSCIYQGAKQHKKGANFNRGAIMLTDTVPIKHAGPASKEKMWDTPACVDCRSVVNPSSRGRTMRYRPRLNDWSLQVEITFDEKMIERAQIIAAAENAGRYIGLGDYRPDKGGPFGRFDVEVLP
jgi:hypothetical protein